MAIAHTRYSTAGNKGDLREVQPLTLNYPYGIGLVHNGNVVNYGELRLRLQEEKKRLCFSSSDTEALLNWLASELKGAAFEHLREAVRSVFKEVKGSYSVVGVLAGTGIFAFRDPNGIRPLVLGKRDNAGGVSYMVASETIALQVCGYEQVRDLEPGELLVLEENPSGAPRLRSEVIEKRTLTPCMFEWVYFASAESEMQSAPVYGMRLALGRKLAHQVKRLMDQGKIQADLVAPVPDTSRTAASSLAEELGLPYREALIKNRYIKRTFILGSQESRSRSVDLKLNPVKSEIKGKSVLLVDDSIVRGTTSKKIVDLVRRAGATKVYFLSTCPPIRYPCYYGIDFPDSTELIAARRSGPEVADAIGADAVVYLELDDLKECIAEVSGGKVKQACMACLDGRYPTDVSQAQGLTDLRRKQRAEGAGK
jgi:amidophosphoribosyltransferase